jgi:hypothetical protein
MSTKVCKVCGIEKSINYFGSFKLVSGQKSYRGTCRDCGNKQKNITRRIRRSDPEYRRAELDKENARNQKKRDFKNRRKIAAKKREEQTNLRVCKICKEEKPFDEFPPRKSIVTGQTLYLHTCTVCNNARIQKWRVDNYDERREYRDKYYKENYDKIREKGKKWYHSNPDKVKKQYESYKSTRNKLKKERYLNDPLFKLRENLRSRTSHAFSDRGYTKKSLTFHYLGLDFKDLKKYIESMFDEGMTWENYGEWHIDHIIPLNAAKDEDELVAFVYYKNLQPLWGDENIRKHDNYNPEDKEKYLKWYKENISK